MTWLGFLNFFVLQWFGVRLARCEAVDRGIVPHRVVTLGEWRTFVGYGGRMSGRVVSIDGNEYRVRWYRLLRWVWPLTGWWSDYRWIARRP